MDLNTVTETVTPQDRAALPAIAEGDAFLAGGTWLFSEPQPELRRLVDLTALGWEALSVSEAGLRIGATCTIAALAALEAPAAWPAAPLIVQCCRALLGSFKVWNMATVGGNLCMALPAGPMAALATALDGECLIWSGAGERRVRAADFIIGPQRTILARGEILRAVEIPAKALRRRTAFRQIALNPLGRSGALLIGTRGEVFALTITAATNRPIKLVFSDPPDEAALAQRLQDSIADDDYFDDVHGHPAWRRHVTQILAEEIRRELSA
jgi:CO/xanthine dehydrogenase FAD-binding subunit